MGAEREEGVWITVKRSRVMSRDPCPAARDLGCEFFTPPIAPLQVDMWINLGIKSRIRHGLWL